MMHKPRNKSAWLASCAAVALVAGSAWADKAETLLGVHDIDPVVREVIDEAFADGRAAIALLARQVASGEMHPGEAADTTITAAQGSVMETMKRMGLGVEVLRINMAWEAFAKARFEARTSQNIRLPKPPKGSGGFQLPPMSHHASADAEASDIDATMKQLDRQLAHIHENHPRGPKISDDDGHKEHVRKVHASAKVDTGIHTHTLPERSEVTPHVDVNRPDIGDISAKPHQPGSMHPGISPNIQRADGGISEPNVNNGVNTDRLSIADIGANANAGTSGVDVSQQISGVNPSLDDLGQHVQDDVGDPSANPALAVRDPFTNPSLDPGVEVQQKINEIQQTVSQKINPKDITEKMQQAVNIDAIKKKAMISVDVDAIRRKSSTALNVKLDDARDKIKAAMGTAFSTVNGFMQKQVDAKQTEYNQKKAAYNAISVPPIRKKRICAKHVAGICVKHTHVPIASSVEAHNKAQAQKDTAKGLMDGAYKELQKYQQGQQTLFTTETNTYSNLDTVFASANTSATVTTDIDSSDAADTATAEDPNSSKRKVPGRGKDDYVVELDSGVNETIISVGSITAALGSDSDASMNIGNIGDSENTTVVGQVTQEVVVPGVISAALGYETYADVRVANVDGYVGGRLDHNVNAGGILAAAIGGESDATVHIANVSGRVTNSARQDAAVVGALAASIGGDTSAEIRMANLNEGVTVGTLDQRIIQATPAIAAAIGYDSDALISVGTIDADVTGNLTQHITLGSVIAAAIGANTTTNIRVGDVNQKITGDLNQTISVGDITNIAVGAGTTANTDVGVIDAPVTGDVDMNITTGVITTATVGVNTRAQTVVGSVRAPVYGNLDVDIGVGDITTFSIGIGTGSKHITANTFVGSVFQPVHGSRSISVHTGGITALGFGLDIDLGPLGTLDLSVSGCDAGAYVNIGNIGKPPC